jgi:hypothetical protein
MRPAGLRQRHNPVERTIETRPYQVVHPGIDNQETLRARLLAIDGAGQQRPGVADDDAPRFGDDGRLEPGEHREDLG